MPNPGRGDTGHRTQSCLATKIVCQRVLCIAPLGLHTCSLCLPQLPLWATMCRASGTLDGTKLEHDPQCAMQIPRSGIIVLVAATRDGELSPMRTGQILKSA